MLFHIYKDINGFWRSEEFKKEIDSFGFVLKCSKDEAEMLAFEKNERNEKLIMIESKNGTRFKKVG